MSENQFIIPEYKIDLLNKSKKIINTIENINLISKNLKDKKVLKKGKKKAKVKETSKRKK